MARLLITTCTPPQEGVYLLDTSGPKVTRLHNRPTRGITEGPNGFYFVEHRGSIFHLCPETWQVIRKLETGLEGCHDLRWIGEEFFLVSSYGNRISRYDRKLRLLDSMQIVEDEGDVCHANCLIEVDGEFLLSVFTLTPGRREEKRNGEIWRHDGKVLRLEWGRKSYEILYEPLSQPHSLVWRDGRLFCCESFTSELAVIEPKTRSKRRLRRLHGFVRGLAFAGNTAYVGISRLKRPTPPTRWERFLSRFRLPCGVLEMDARTWRIRRAFPIPGSEVYDILILD